MDLNYTEEQQLILDAVRDLVGRYNELEQSERRAPYSYAASLWAELESAEFLDAGLTPGMGAVEAALVVEEVSAGVRTVEIGASSLVGPFVAPDVPRPLALILSSQLGKPHRFLKEAKSALVLLEDENDVAVLDLTDVEIDTVESIFAYPFARFRTVPELAAARRLGPGSGDKLRQWWRLSIAAECAGAMRSALDFTVDYVKERRVFGKPLGVLQAIQHRLALGHEVVTGLHWLLMRAAWSRSPLDAVLVAIYAQQHIQQHCFDLHQFNGGMGVTLEHKLHFWTYRFRALEGELGGVSENALAGARLAWGPGASPATLPKLMRGTA